jgi:ABC-2 type transport system ATP-binding protein
MYAIELEQLKKTYANGVEALKGIDLTVEAGDFFALLGANGAGKSTTIGLITTLLTKTDGVIRIYGYDLDKEPRLAKSYLGLVPQEINLNIFETCEQILINQAGYYGMGRSVAKARAMDLLMQLGLYEKRHNIVRHLSGGMKRRLMIARALVHSPRVLILDEPTAGVDVEIRREMWDFLRQINQQGTTIILTTHYLEEAEQLCKNIAIMNKGQLIKKTSMRHLLQSLRHQTFVFDTLQPVTQLPQIEDLQFEKLDGHTFELRVSNRLSLNELFVIFNEHNIQIGSMRNKTNRLEELFMDLIHDSR